MLRSACVGAFCTVCGKAEEAVADVVVVGAGYSGLSAARDLKAAGLSVVVFEANDRVGGRVLNYDLGQLGLNGTMELGGQWLAKPKDQPYAWKLIKDELGFKEEASAYGTGTGYFYTTRYPHGEPHDSADPLGGLQEAVGQEALQKLLQVNQKLTELKKRLPRGREELDSMSFHSWLVQQGVNADVLQVLRGMGSLSLFCDEPFQVSALQAVQAFGNNGLILESTDAQSYRILGGMQAPALAMARKLSGSVHLASPVTSIWQDDAGVLVTAQPAFAEPKRVRAKRVLFSGSPWTSLRVTFAPPLPYEKIQLFQRMPMGNAFKAQLVYARPFWKDSNISGLIVNLLDLNSKPVNCMDNSPLDSNYGIALCFVEGALSYKLALMTKDERGEYIAEFVSHTLGEEAKKPLAYIDHIWGSESHIGGGFSAVWEPGVYTQFGQYLNTDFRNVTWIGTDTVPLASPNVSFQFGYVEGAVYTGRTAARRVIAELQGQLKSALIV